jgi:hypothetical protein
VEEMRKVTRCPVRTVGVLAESLIPYMSNTIQKHYSVSQLAWSFEFVTEFNAIGRPHHETNQRQSGYIFTWLVHCYKRL